MQVPLEIYFHNTAKSGAVESMVRERAEKLERFADNISCRVTIDAPHKHHRRGKLFRVSVDVHLPGGHVVLEQIPPAVQGHFHRESDMQRLRLRRQVREGRTSLVIGLLALTLCMTTATFAPAEALGAFGNVAVESLVIAGWVAMWHPLEVLLYGVWPVRRERRLLQRLANAEVVLTSSTQARVAA